jgi:hypothetical protein
MAHLFFPDFCGGYGNRENYPGVCHAGTKCPYLERRAGYRGLAHAFLKGSVLYKGLPYLCPVGKPHLHRWILRSLMYLFQYPVFIPEVSAHGNQCDYS